MDTHLDGNVSSSTTKVSSCHMTQDSCFPWLPWFWPPRMNSDMLWGLKAGNIVCRPSPSRGSSSTSNKRFPADDQSPRKLALSLHSHLFLHFCSARPSRAALLFPENIKLFASEQKPVLILLFSILCFPHFRGFTSGHFPPTPEFISHSLSLLKSGIAFIRDFKKTPSFPPQDACGRGKETE